METLFAAGLFSLLAIGLFKKKLYLGSAISFGIGLLYLVSIPVSYYLLKDSQSVVLKQETAVHVLYPFMLTIGMLMLLTSFYFRLAPEVVDRLPETMRHKLSWVFVGIASVCMTPSVAHSLLFME